MQGKRKGSASSSKGVTRGAKSRPGGARLAKGGHKNKAASPAEQARNDLPKGYALVLKDIKARIQRERLRVVLAANSAMVQLYWDIGKVILERQRDAGWGAKVIDRLAADLRRAFPDQAGFSPRNLKYMRAFAAAWPDAEIVQRLVAQLPWRQNIALIERLENSDERCGMPSRSSETGGHSRCLCCKFRTTHTGDTAVRKTTSN